MSTIKYALEQKKPIFIFEPKIKQGDSYVGYMEAIRKGAKSFLTVDDIKKKIKEIQKDSFVLNKNTSIENYLK